MISKIQRRNYLNKICYLGERATNVDIGNPFTSQHKMRLGYRSIWIYLRMRYSVSVHTDEFWNRCSLIH